MRIVVAFVVLFGLTGTGFAEGDVAELTNGDRISGTIVQMDGEQLIITTPYVKNSPSSGRT